MCIRNWSLGIFELQLFLQLRCSYIFLYCIYSRELRVQLYILTSQCFTGTYFFPLWSTVLRLSQSPLPGRSAAFPCSYLNPNVHFRYQWHSGGMSSNTGRDSSSPVLSYLHKPVSSSLGQEGTGLRCPRAAMRLQAHISCPTRCLWRADLSSLPISHLSAWEPISKALPTFHGSKACVNTARLDCQHCWIYWFVLLCVMVTWLEQRDWF